MMPIPKPSTTDLCIRMSEGGTLAIFYKGELLPGVTQINVVQERGRRADVTVSFIGLAVRLETEPPACG